MEKKIRKKHNTEDVLIHFNKIHNNKYEYPDFRYNTMHHYIDVVCPIHGKFSTILKHHFNGVQCRKCTDIQNRLKQIDTTNSFIEKAVKLHGNIYDYSKVIYGNNAHDKVKIVCFHHGEFLQTPNNHLTGSGCKKCNKLGGWTRTDWVKSCEGKTGKLYIIKCWNDEEQFYKIGITVDFEKRFAHKSQMPYNFEVIKVIEEKDDPAILFNLERSLHKLHGKVKYEPKINFGGFSECFKELLI